VVCQVFEERIAIKGKPDHVERVVVTRHGPVISGYFPAGEHVLALSSMALRPSDAFDGFAAINEASNWDEFVAGVERIEAPALNIVYADDSGNIGYYVSGRVPIRTQGHGAVPAPGWSGDHEWLGEIPFTEMPHSLNPEAGDILTCNNRIVADDYPYFLSQSWMNGYRARRLEELVNQNGPSATLSLDDCQRFQLDTFSVAGKELARSLIGMQPLDPDAALSLRLLSEWDGWLTVDSVGGSVYQVLLQTLARAILEPRLTEVLRHDALGRGLQPLLQPATEYYGYWPITLRRMVANPVSGWLAAADREAVLSRCLAETTAELRRRLGPRPEEWRWGRLHQVSFPHAMSAVPVLDRVFGQGPFAIGGDTDTLCQTAIAPDRPYANNAFSVSYRQVIDLGNLDNSRAMYAPGQSGHLASPYYGNMIAAWLAGDYFPMSWSEKAVSGASRHLLTLTPTGKATPEA
jgi:penicillin amidase